MSGGNNTKGSAHGMKQGDKIRKSMAFQKGDINSSELETQENTFDKAEELVSSKKRGKGSGLGYTTNLNSSEVNLPNEKEKKAEKKEESDEEDVF